MKSAADALGQVGFKVPDRQMDAILDEVLGYDVVKRPAKLQLPGRKAALLYATMAQLLALNVVLAIMTGWAQMYIKFLPIFVWDVPANVIGVSCAQAAHGPSNARVGRRLSPYDLRSPAACGAPHLSRSRAGRSR